MMEKISLMVPSKTPAARRLAMDITSPSTQLVTLAADEDQRFAIQSLCCAAITPMGHGVAEAAASRNVEDVFCRAGYREYSNSSGWSLGAEHWVRGQVRSFLMTYWVSCVCEVGRLDQLPQ